MEKAQMAERLEGKLGLLAGRQMLPREVAKLCHDNGWHSYDRLVTMVAIVGAESLRFTEAVGGPNSNGSSDWGIFQLNSDHAQTLGMDEERFKAIAFNPVEAVKYARALYVWGSILPDSSEAYTFRPWYAGPDGNKSYEKHLPGALTGVANMYAELLGLSPVPYLDRRSA